MSLPLGFRLRADRSTRPYGDGTLLGGGSPPRLLRLTGRGAEVAARMLSGCSVDDAAAAALGRRLVDAGLAHPVPPADPAAEVAVVVPVYDDAAALDRCLTALGGQVPVTVVDDGSADAAAVAAVAAAHGARLLRQDVNQGPAAARGAGLAALDTDLVALVDADAVTSAGALLHLAAHLADPLVAAAAPRIRSTRRRRGRMLSALAEAWSPLDLGPAPSAVGTGRRVPYVPTTVLVVRRADVEGIGGFDRSLRFGEDVDLVWRLAAAGRSVRYDPAVVARHEEPATWRRWLSRRFAYGTSAAPLTVRHPAAMAPATLRPLPLAAAVAAVAGRPRIAAALAAVPAVRVQRRLASAGMPTRPAVVGAAVAPLQTALAGARWATQLGWPALALAASRSRRCRRAAVALAAAPPLVEWVVRRPRLDPLRWVVAVWADEAAYGLGVWAGCVRQRSVRAVLPRLR